MALPARITSNSTPVPAWVSCTSRMHSHRVLRRWLLACYKSKDSVLDIQQRLSDPGKPAVYRYLPAALGFIPVGCHRDDLRAFKLRNALILKDRRHYGSP